jgi:hypothetical protein
MRSERATPHSERRKIQTASPSPEHTQWWSPRERLSRSAGPASGAKDRPPYGDMATCGGKILIGDASQWLNQR